MGKINRFFREKLLPSDIKSLPLSSQNFSGGKLEGFINKLDDYPLLVELDMSFNAITDEDVYKLIEKLKVKKGSKISSLDLSSNSISDDGAKALAALPLSSLYLSGNRQLTNACVESFLQNYSLVYLDLTANDLIDRGKKNQIQHRLESNRKQKKVSFLKEIINLSHVAKRRPDLFNQYMALPLIIIFEFLASEVKEFIANVEQIVPMAHLIYNKSLENKLQKDHIQRAKMFLNNEIGFEDINEKFNGKKVSYCNLQ